MSASMVARRSSTSLHWLCHTHNSISSRPSNPTLLQPPLSPSRLRRHSVFLCSLLPIHSAIASASLVSKLPNELTTSTQGRFTNYVRGKNVLKDSTCLKWRSPLNCCFVFV